MSLEAMVKLHEPDDGAGSFNTIYIDPAILGAYGSFSYPNGKTRTLIRLPFYLEVTETPEQIAAEIDRAYGIYDPSDPEKGKV